MERGRSETGEEGAAGAGSVVVDPVVRAAFAASMTTLFEAALVVVLDCMQQLQIPLVVVLDIQQCPALECWEDKGHLLGLEDILICRQLDMETAAHQTPVLELHIPERLADILKAGLPVWLPEIL